MCVCVRMRVYGCVCRHLEVECVCVCACVCVCMGAYVCASGGRVYVCVRVCARVYVRMRMRVCARMYVHPGVECVCACASGGGVCVCACVCENCHHQLKTWPDTAPPGYRAQWERDELLNTLGSFKLQVGCPVHVYVTEAACIVSIR